MLLNWTPAGVCNLLFVFVCVYITGHTNQQPLPLNNCCHQLVPLCCVYTKTEGFTLSPSVACATALISGNGPGLASSALLHSICSKTQLKAAHRALQPKITLHVSHPEHTAHSSSHKVPFCGKWPPPAFSVCSYFWRNGKIFPESTRREIILQKKLFFSTLFWILWSWRTHNVV